MGNAGITVIAFNELQNRANTLQSEVNDLKNKVQSLESSSSSASSSASSASNSISSAGSGLPTRPSGRKRRFAEDLPNIMTPEDLFGDLSYLNDVRISRQLVSKIVLEF